MRQTFEIYIEILMLLHKFRVKNRILFNSLKQNILLIVFQYIVIAIQLYY